MRLSLFGDGESGKHRHYVNVVSWAGMLSWV